MFPESGSQNAYYSQEKALRLWEKFFGEKKFYTTPQTYIADRTGQLIKYKDHGNKVREKKPGPKAIELVFTAFWGTSSADVEEITVAKWKGVRTNAKTQTEEFEKDYVILNDGMVTLDPHINKFEMIILDLHHANRNSPLWWPVPDDYNPSKIGNPGMWERYGIKKPYVFNTISNPTTAIFHRDNSEDKLADEATIFAQQESVMRKVYGINPKDRIELYGIISKDKHVDAISISSRNYENVVGMKLSEWAKGNPALFLQYYEKIHEVKMLSVLKFAQGKGILSFQPNGIFLDDKEVYQISPSDPRFSDTDDACLWLVRKFDGPNDRLYQDIFVRSVQEKDSEKKIPTLEQQTVVASGNDAKPPKR